MAATILDIRITPEAWCITVTPITAIPKGTQALASLLIANLIYGALVVTVADWKENIPLILIIVVIFGI